MAKMLLNQELFPEISSSKLDIIELGAGTGLPSVVLCKKGHHVVSTDISKLLPVIEASFDLNKPITGDYKIQAL